MSATIYVSLDDFLQLQSLLNYEQEKRNQHIEECQGQNTSIQQYLSENKRLSDANYRLQQLKEQYKRRRVQEIQDYLDQYRRQALIRAVLQDEEECYYRQCIAAALEQRRVQTLWQHYFQDSNKDYAQYRSQQLGELLKQVFAQEQQEQVKDSPTNIEEVWKCLIDQRKDAETPRPPSTVTLPESSNALPPLDDHVITLQDLVQELASKPVTVNPYFNDEPKPSGIWMNDVQPTVEEPVKKTFLPQHIFTEAEPTPTLESIPNTPLTQASSEFVDSIAAEQAMHAVTPENKDLDDIAFELRDDGEIVERWRAVLESQLEFKKEEGGTLVLTASTEANRQFLGSEDELMRVMLKLDAIVGDERVRQRRKELVKKIDSMLDQLDQFKKRQWERYRLL